MKKRLMNLASIIIMIMIVMIGCDSVETESETINTVVPIKIGNVNKDIVEKTYMTIGEVIPNNHVDIYLDTTGEIKSVFVKPGDYIEKGMPLFQLINSDVNRTLNTNESQLRTARDLLEVQYNSANENYNQQKALFESGVVSQNALTASYDQLQLIERQYQDAISNYKNQLGSLRSNVNDLLFKSPINGRIASLYVEVGQKARNQIAATVIDNSVLYVKTMVLSEIKKNLQLEQDVTLILEGIDGAVNGKIGSINEIPDISNKLFEVRIRITDDVDISVGDFSEVKFVTQSYEALLVPSAAIVRKGIEKYIFVYESDTLKKIVLETGLSKGEWIEVISDELDENSKVVVRGQENLREEDVVEIIE